MTEREYLIAPWIRIWHWTNAALPDTLTAWVAGAAEHPGSWWADWDAWLNAGDDRMIAAPANSCGQRAARTDRAVTDRASPLCPASD